jgi:hypothetical protein
VLQYRQQGAFGGIFEIEPDKKPEPGDKEDGDPQIDDENGPGEALEPVAQQEETENEKGGEERRLDHIDKIGYPCITPHPSVKIESEKTKHLDQDDEGAPSPVK